MKLKNKILLLIPAVLIIGLYNLIVFLVVKDKQLAFWMSYGFVMLALLISTASFIGMFGKKRQALMGVPMTMLSVIYTVCALIAGSIIMAFPNAEFLPVFLPQFLIFLVFIIFFIPTLVAKNVISDRNKHIKEKRNFIALLSLDVTTAISYVSDADVKRSLERFAEDIKYSDPMSHASLSDVENRLTFTIEQIKDAARRADTDDIQKLIADAKRYLDERNAKCRILK